MNGTEAKQTRFDPALILLLLAAFAAPVAGGYVVNDATRLAPGLPSLIASLIDGSDAPLLTHALVGIAIFAAWAIVLLRRRIQQTPNQIFSALWLAFFALLGLTAALSAFKWLAAVMWLEWLVYGCALMAVVGAAGRKIGPTLLLAAISGGCTLVAIKGILEYGANRATDPNWRAFAGWVNPNASAAMLLIGFFAALGLCLSRARHESLLLGALAAMMGFAMVLTGSKGAVSFALPIGTLVLGLSLCSASGMRLAALICVSGLAAAIVTFCFYKNLGWIGPTLGAIVCIGTILFGPKRQDRLPIAGRIAGVGLGVAVLVLLLSVTAKPPAALAEAAKNLPVATPISRIASGGVQSQEQSTEFRLNLWKSSVKLISSRPLTGYGLGSYRYESGRPGLTTSTLFSHNVYLQVAAEAGILSALLLLAGVGWWFWLTLRNLSRLPPSQLIPLSGVIAAVSALLTHSLVDSDLFYFGIGVAFFMLLGIGLLLSTDAVAPEFVPAPLRRAGAGGLGLLGVFMLIAAAGDDAKGVFRFDRDKGDVAALMEDANSLAWLAAFDGDADYLLALTKSTPDERLAVLKKAFELAPSERAARSLAGLQAELGDRGGAIGTLSEALARDPKNLSSLAQLARLEEQNGDEPQALALANRLVAVESSPYFKIRSIPEIIPTETYLIRIEILAPHEQDPKKRADVLRDAVRGMVTFENTTVDRIRRSAADAKDPNLRMPGFDTLSEAQTKLREAQEAASAAKALYLTLGDGATADEMKKDEALFATAAADAGGNK